MVMLTAGHGSIAEEDVVHPCQAVVLQPLGHLAPPDPSVGKLARGAQRHVVLLWPVPGMDTGHIRCRDRSLRLF